MEEGFKLQQRHGKARVRVGRVWRDGDGTHHFSEWNVSISLLSDCLPAYVAGDNSDIVATDTMKNTVYAKAKECSQRLPVEDFAIELAKHFTSYYKQVTAAIIRIVEKPWERVNINGRPHAHVRLQEFELESKGWGSDSIGLDLKFSSFKLGSEKHTTEVFLEKSGVLQVTSGIEGLAVLKTTKSGFEGFIRDKYTMLPETQERMLATEITALWRYSFKSLSSVPMKNHYFAEMYMDVKKVLLRTFFGCPKEGVYSPSVQSTLYDMAKAALGRFPELVSIQLKMPNLHFLPVNLSSKDNPAIVKFGDDVYLPTDEPHGSIEATLSRIHSKI
nr:uricase-2 isozyme 1 [Ipomoea batatas]